jgi:hypothetical protein
MLEKIFTLALMCAVFCGLLYFWWRLALIFHELRERLYGDKHRLITLFTYGPKRKGR